jgi:hypothetical protein
MTARLRYASLLSALLFLAHAFQNFVPDLKDHLLGRMRGTPDAEFTDADRQTLIIENNRIFSHKVLRINYTTYDVRRDQDSINPRTRSDIMLLASEKDREKHPYYYARVIGIFHVLVRCVGGERRFKQLDFLWVRWYDFDMKARSGFKAKRHHQLSFVDSEHNVGGFGFIDPADVLRAVHLMPRFSFGRTTALLGPSIARRDDENNEDYKRYYVNM